MAKLEQKSLYLESLLDARINESQRRRMKDLISILNTTPVSYVKANVINLVNTPAQDTCYVNF